MIPKIIIANVIVPIALNILSASFLYPVTYKITSNKIQKINGKITGDNNEVAIKLKLPIRDKTMVIKTIAPIEVPFVSKQEVIILAKKDLLSEVFTIFD